MLLGHPLLPPSTVWVRARRARQDYDRGDFRALLGRFHRRHVAEGQGLAVIATHWLDHRDVAVPSLS